MDYLTKINWSIAWDIIKDIIIPHTATLVFNIILFVFIGLVLSIIYCVILSKKGIFKRKPKYYNWAVKLYIPTLIGVFLYIFTNIGFLRGFYKIIDKERDPIVTSVYDHTLSFAFKTEEAKNNFVKKVQVSANEVKDGSNHLMVELKKASLDYNSGISLIDDSKNKAAHYLIEKYGDDIYKISLYGMLNIAGAKAHTNINESLPYNEFSAGMDLLLEIGHKDIEQSIKDKLVEWFSSLLYYQYKSMIKPLIIILLIIISIPIIEFIIYKKWIEPAWRGRN